MLAVSRGSLGTRSGCITREKAVNSEAVLFGFLVYMNSGRLTHLEEVWRGGEKPGARHAGKGNIIKH